MFFSKYSNGDYGDYSDYSYNIVIIQSTAVEDMESGNLRIVSREA